ncbi:MAG: hypothetical protein ACREMJ_07025 [Gemmatimonadales bacterium]
MQMLKDNRRLVEIQEFVDARYAAQQRYRTPTPLPPAHYVAPAYRAAP